jgi:hypothetical protein
MSIAFVQKTPDTTIASRSGNAVSLTTSAFLSNVVVGNIVITCCVQYRSGGSPEDVTFSDSGGNTWYIDANYTDTYDRVTIAHCYPISTDTITVTATTATGSYKCLGAAEFSGVAIGLTAGATANSSNHGSSNSATSGTIISSGNCLYIGGLVVNNAVVITQDINWMLIHEDESWTASTISWIYRLANDSQNAVWALGSSIGWAACGVSYIEATDEGGSLIGGSLLAGGSLLCGQGVLIR